MSYKEYVKKEQWDALKTKEALYKEFEGDRLAETFKQDSEMPLFYKDNEFKEMAAKIKKAAAPLLPLLKDVLKHLPEKDYHNYTYYPERADGAIKQRINPSDPEGMALYAAILLLALESDFIERLGEGIGIPEQRAARRAYKRYLAFKEKDNARRTEFEQTAAYRLQTLEMKLGMRDHIDYPE